MVTPPPGVALHKFTLRTTQGNRPALTSASMTDSASAPDHASVAAHPPYVYLASIVVGWTLHLLVPVTFVPGGAGTPIGLAMIALAFAIFGLANRQFSAVGTTIPTNTPTSAIATRGPYRFSRNPIYVALSLLHLGIAFWVDSVWLLATLSATFVFMNVGVVAREERYLETKFGEEYLRYKRSVRRWL